MPKEKQTARWTHDSIRMLIVLLVLIGFLLFTGFGVGQGYYMPHMAYSLLGYAFFGPFIMILVILMLILIVLLLLRQLQKKK